MTKKLDVIIRPEAEIEIISAYDWYNSHVKNLGNSFIDYLDEKLDQISLNPELYPIEYRDLRKALLKKFPFCVYYRINLNKIIVFAVFHVKRNPTDWKKRT